MVCQPFGHLRSVLCIVTIDVLKAQTLMKSGEMKLRLNA